MSDPAKKSAFSREKSHGKNGISVSAAALVTAETEILLHIDTRSYML